MNLPGTIEQVQIGYLKRFSNTNNFIVSNYPKDQWSMTRVILDKDNKVLSILGPGNQLFTKQYYMRM
jgi:hypothetical protein